MPELPEVEITCQGVRAASLRRRINQIIIRESQLRWPVPSELSHLKAAKIIAVERRAKYILIRTPQGTLIIHLGMSGRLRALTQALPREKHDHLDFILDNGGLLRYTDPRRFGAVLWTTEEPNLHPLLFKLGVEPLSRSFNGKYLFEKSRHKNVLIKQLIMDQRVVVGVGNIYANEALFAAGILPTRKAQSLSENECYHLATQIRAVLRQAILQGGTTLRDFLSPSGKPGYFWQKLLVYGREAQPCLCCKALLQSRRIAQRSTVFCKVCQT